VIGHSFVIFNYGIFPESMAQLAAEGVTLHHLATWWDALGVAQALGYFAPEQFAAVKAFLENPDGWSAARGGTSRSGTGS
jgi:orotate phosphoribosyltransferase